jgi:hypothetical protein
MVDLMGYINIDNGQRKLVLRSADDSIDCKSRFKLIAHEIPFSYDDLVQALNDAIDKEAKLTGGKFVTDDGFKAPEVKEYDYDALMSEFQTIVGSLMEKNSATNGPKITQIIEKYLGKGKKISETSRDQAEFIHLIVEEIKEDLK